MHSPKTHVVLALHASAAPHAPSDPHVCTPLPLHWVVAGMHVTHPPFKHTGVVPLQGVTDAS